MLKCVNESDVNDFFEILMCYMHPTVQIPTNVKYFHYRQKLLKKDKKLQEIVIRELINLID